MYKIYGNKAVGAAKILRNYVISEIPVMLSEAKYNSCEVRSS